MHARNVLCAIAIGLASMQATCFAGFVLNIDSVNEELWFTGSDQGTLEDIGGPGPYTVSWTLGIFDPPADVINLAPTGGPTYFNPPPIDDDSFVSVLEDSGTSTGLNFYMTFSSDLSDTLISAVALQPNERLSYFSFSPTSKAYLSSLTSSNFLTPAGTNPGWANIAINPVPEPSSLAAIGLLAGAVSLVAVRRSKVGRSRLLR